MSSSVDKVGVWLPKAVVKLTKLPQFAEVGVLLRHVELQLNETILKKIWLTKIKVPTVLFVSYSDFDSYSARHPKVRYIYELEPTATGQML